VLRNQQLTIPPSVSNWMAYLLIVLHIKKQICTFVSMRIKDDIRAKLKDFIDLCKNHKVKYLYAFGSSTTEKFDHLTSDIDLVVEIDSPDPLERGEKLIDLWDKFENFFNRKVDLLTDSSIKNPILRKSIDNSKILIYDGTGKEILI
jgi:predicted nucleotidyltransferase